MNKYQKCTFYGLGPALLVFGLFISGFWWHLYEHIVISKLIIADSPSSESFKTWTSDEVPLHFSIYMFNWTNPQASLKKLEKPRFQEVGPYVYRLQQLKGNITWNANDTVTYFTRQLWHFVPELSNGSEDDSISSPNVVLLSISRYVAYSNKIIKIAVNEFLKFNKIELHIVKTARELLFEGYDDKLLDILNIIKRVKPISIPDRFGWYLPKNLSIPDIFNMYTGEAHLDNLGIIHSWNYTAHNPAFEGACGVIRGSPGDFWPIDIAQRNNASLYISDFCSNFFLQNMGHEEVNDIDGVRFEGTEATFDNGTLDPQFSCYCPKSACKMKSGVRNMTACVKAPVFVSFPHFYLADESYRNAIEGVNPDAEKHKFTMTFQEHFGVVLKGAARLQLNLHLEPIKGMTIFENIPDVIIPVLWFEESINLPSHIIDKLHMSFTTIPLILTAIGLLLVIVGSILLVSGLIITRLTFQAIPYVNERL